MAKPVQIIGAGIVTLEVKVSGRPISDDYQVMKVTTQDRINGIPSAELTIADGSASEEDFAASASDDFVPGSDIEISAGYDARNEVIFSGVIMRQKLTVRGDGTSALTLVCFDKAVALTTTRTSRQFNEMTQAEALTALVTAAGLTAAVDDTGPVLPHQIKNDASDWDFIVNRADANGQIVRARDGTVTIGSPAFDAPALEVRYGDSLIEMDLELDAARQLTEITARAWDPDTQSVVDSTAGLPQVNQQGSTGDDVLAAASGVEHEVLTRRSGVGADTLSGWAAARMLKSRLSRFSGHITFVGNAGLLAGDLLKLDGLGARFNGDGYVSGVRHRIAGGAWTTSAYFGLDADWYAESDRTVSAPPAAALRPGVSGLQIAQVLQTHEDPAGAFRIKVTFPLIGDDTQGVWVRLASPYATAGAGITFRPEIGDEVVLGFLDGDPLAGIVLGSLHSVARAAPVEADEINSLKGIASRSGVKFTMDDEKNAVRIETPAGHVITLDDDTETVRLEDSNSNSVSLSEDGIEIVSSKDIKMTAAGSVSITGDGGVSIESASDVDITGSGVAVEAAASVSVEGGASAELSSGGQTTVQGSIVAIN